MTYPGAIWIKDVDAMKAGDPCEFRFPARKEYHPATVVVNGGGGYWTVESDEHGTVKSIYAEHVRAPGGQGPHDS